MKIARRRRVDCVRLWLAAVFLCALAGHALARGSGPGVGEARAPLPDNQPTGAIPSPSTNPGRSSVLFVPVLLTASGQNNAFFTSELTLTNRGGEQATLHHTYTAHRGGGSGKASDRLAPGQQKIEPDALAYLRRLGIPIPQSGDRLGTLRVEVPDSANLGVSVRITTLVPEGRAGLSYPGIAAASGYEEAVHLCGLRQNGQDRSNVSLQHMGTPEDGPITLRVTVFSGDPESAGRNKVLPGLLTLSPGGFHQYNGVLNEAGFANGYVKVERVSG